MVINSALRSGGTWQGAIENLKHGWVPLYVRTPGEGDGNAALVAEGALPFALTPDSPDTLIGLFGAQAVSQPLSGDETADAQQSLLAPGAGALAEAAPSESPPVSAQEELPPQPGPEALAVHPTAATDLLAGSFVEDPSRTTGPTIDESAAAEDPVPVGSGGIALDMYADFSDKLESLLGGEALSEEEVATQLCLEKSQAKAWLKRAIGDGLVEKLKKPVRYALSRQSSQSSLC